MKIKGSIKNLKINSAFTVAIVGTFIALCLRLYQVFNGMIDFETGFFTEENFSTVLLYGVLGVTAAAVFVISFLAGKVPQDKLPEGKNIAVAVLSVAFAVGLIISAVPLFESYMTLSASYNPFFNEQSHFSFLMKSGALPKLLEGIFAILSVVYLIVLAFRFSGLWTVDLNKLKIFALSPLFWATFRMIQRFTRTISFMNVSTLFLELFMIAFMMMFFMYFAQMSAEVNNRCISYKVIAYGLIAGMFAAVVSVPKLLLSLFDEGYKSLEAAGKLACPQEAADLVFVVFIFAVAAFFVASPKVKNMTLKEADELIEEEK